MKAFHRFPLKCFLKRFLENTRSVQRVQKRQNPNIGKIFRFFSWRHPCQSVLMDRLLNKTDRTPMPYWNDGSINKNKTSISIEHPRPDWNDGSINQSNVHAVTGSMFSINQNKTSIPIEHPYPAWKHVFITRQASQSNTHAKTGSMFL